MTKKPAQPGVIVKDRAPDTRPDEAPDKEDGSDETGIDACSEDLIKAIHDKDIKAASAAIKAAFEILDAQPHEEGPHVEPHSYAAQNAKARED